MNATTPHGINPQSMAVDADAALAIERARGVPIPEGADYAAVFHIGFCAGAAWAIQKVKEVAP